MSEGLYRRINQDVDTDAAESDVETYTHEELKKAYVANAARLGRMRWSYLRFGFFCGFVLGMSCTPLTLLQSILVVMQMPEAGR